MNYLKEHKPLCVAYSGGVDSVFLLKAAKMALGDEVFAVLAKSSVLSERDYRDALKTASEIGLKCEVMELDILTVKELKENHNRRCYFCKMNTFSNILTKAKEMGAMYVADGKNTDDSMIYRPGAQAAQELGVISPLSDTGFSKAEIRQYSKKLGLSTWDKPSNACLATRLPYNTEVTKEKLRVIEQAEEFLIEKGLKGIRVRLHEDIARIEAPKDSFAFFADNAELVNFYKSLGIRYITLDLEGFRSGSMD